MDDPFSSFLGKHEEYLKDGHLGAGRMSAVRSDHAAAAQAGGRVLITGGIALGAGASIGISASAEIFDPVTEQFTPVPTALPMKAPHAAVTAPDGSVLVFRGEVQHGQSGDPVQTDGVLRHDPG